MRIPKEDKDYPKLVETGEAREGDTSSFPCLVKIKRKIFGEDIEGFIEEIDYKVDYFGNTDNQPYEQGFWINKYENEEYLDFVEGIFPN